MIARKRWELDFEPYARVDAQILQAENPWAYLAMLEALQYLVKTPDQGDPKSKRLEGHLSWSFPASPEDIKTSGRVVYHLEGGSVIVKALSDDHDEAYRRAQARFKPKRR